MEDTRKHALTCAECGTSFPQFEPPDLPEPYMSPLDSDAQHVTCDTEPLPAADTLNNQIWESPDAQVYVFCYTGSPLDGHVVDITQMREVPTSGFLCNNCLMEYIAEGAYDLGNTEKGDERAIHVLDQKNRGSLV